MGQLEGNSLANHFSHGHPLKSHAYITRKVTCSACKQGVSGSFYACLSCNFYLHKKCFDLPQTLKHHSDRRHNLVLLSSPAYPEGFFKCNACGTHGNGFSYHCSDCQIDLHTTCALMPPSVNHTAHDHTLGLCFTPPYENQGFSCDICKKPGSNHWLYRCGLCDFDAHMKCAMARTTSREVLPMARTTSREVLPKSTSLPHYRTNHFSPPQPPPLQSATPSPSLVQIYYNSSSTEYPLADHHHMARTASSQAALNKSASLPHYETHHHFSPPPPPPPPRPPVQQPYYYQAEHHPQYHQSNHYQGATTMGVPVQTSKDNGFMKNMAGHAVEGLVGSVVEAVLEGMVS
ncbi:uncharacterized protein LOC112512274 [Cynara cardunculus var. scolymus]|uniref:C1-like protein n=1 Tax=Cynara cardunculus var. scolymus TaxID=59895 RepID=A0A103Y6R9_CYNCS|nr:uncharacterized protein LOC112512274 [Cynara cardunculus var. scolymus]KVI03546.1 C1-like protein [Cynara cardunculus var. scolymus]